MYFLLVASILKSWYCNITANTFFVMSLASQYLHVWLIIDTHTRFNSSQESWRAGKFKFELNNSFHHVLINWTYFNLCLQVINQSSIPKRVQQISNWCRLHDSSHNNLIIQCKHSDFEYLCVLSWAFLIYRLVMVSLETTSLTAWQNIEVVHGGKYLILNCILNLSHWSFCMYSITCRFLELMFIFLSWSMYFLKPHYLMDIDT